MAPMVLIVTLDQQCSIMSGHVYLWHSSSSNAPQSFAATPSSRLLATSTAICASPCLTVEVVVIMVRAGVIKLDIFSPWGMLRRRSMRVLIFP